MEELRIHWPNWCVDYQPSPGWKSQDSNLKFQWQTKAMWGSAWSHDSPVPCSFLCLNTNTSFKERFRTHRCMGPPFLNFGQLRFFGQQEKLGKASFQEVSMFFFSMCGDKATCTWLFLKCWRQYTRMIFLTHWLPGVPPWTSKDYGNMFPVRVFECGTYPGSDTCYIVFCRTIIHLLLRRFKTYLHSTMGQQHVVTLDVITLKGRNFMPTL